MIFLGNSVMVLFLSTQSLILSVFTMKLIILPLPIIFYILYRIFIFSINSERESCRIESITKIPLISFVSETSEGISTIRSFQKQKKFVTRNNKLLNNKILAN